MMKLSIVLKQLREEKGYTIEELAKKAGIGSGTLGDIETGKNKSTSKTINKIISALGLNQNEKNELYSAFLGKEIIAEDPRVAQLNKRELSQYEKTMNEASLFFNDEATSEADKQKLLMAMNEMFFLSKEINKKKFAHKTDKKEEK